MTNEEKVIDEETEPESQIDFETLFIKPQSKSNEGQIATKEGMIDIETMINNVFTRDLTTSNLTPDEYRLVLKYLRLCQFLKTAMLETGNNYSKAINFLIEIVQSKCHSSKSKSGWSNIMTRSQFAQSEVIETLVQQALEGEHKKEGMLDKVRKRMSFGKRRKETIKEAEF